MPIITLTSDYGYTDPYLASVKGVIIKELENASIVDISHNIEPGNIIEASFVLRHSYDHFPEGSVHIIAVQEVIENMRLLVIELDDHFFLVADNGMAGMINPEVKITKVTEINLRQEETLFPVRDVFAKAACHIARGGKTGVLGREVKDYKESTFVRPRIQNEGSVILGSVVYVDNFGNLITNISRKMFKEVGKDRNFEIELPRSQTIKKIQDSYYPSSAGSILAIFNSMDLLEVAVSGARGKNYNGANTLLGIDVQDTITVTFS